MKFIKLTGNVLLAISVFVMSIIITAAIQIHITSTLLNIFISFVLTSLILNWLTKIIEE